MKERNDSLERVSNYIDSILKCAEHQKILVDDVLDMSKMYHKQIQLFPVPFQLSSVVDLVVEMFRTRVQEKNLRFNVSVPSGNLAIKADKGRLQQVIINLVSNAIKVTSKGEIMIRAQLQDINNGKLKVEVTVQDTGIGIPQDQIPRLFDRFSQIRTYQPPGQYAGTGLGLAISKRLVEAMGGRITVESTPGVGTTFSFFIIAEKVTEEDMKSTQEAKMMSPEAPTEVSSNMLILIVDDNTLNQKILSTYLKKAGYSVEVASDGVEAVQKATHRCFDLIFMDIEMPNMNGMEATAAIRQREQDQSTFCPRTPIIGLSGNARKEKIEAAMQTGMDLYITKPYHREDILKAVSNMSIRPKVRKSVGDEGVRFAKLQKS